jgi:hypothetical protein
MNGKPSMAGAWYLMKIFSRFRILLIVAGWVLARLQAYGAETSLIPFELESHDEKTYTRGSWAGHPLLVAVSTRESAPHNTGLVWSRPIATAVTAAAPDAALLRVATLPGGVPRLFRGMVADALAPAGNDPIQISLLDWKNLFAQKYELSSSDYNVLVFDRHGALVYRVGVGSFNQQQLDKILSELQALKGRL